MGAGGAGAGGRRWRGRCWDSVQRGAVRPRAQRLANVPRDPPPYRRRRRGPAGGAGWQPACRGARWAAAGQSAAASAAADGGASDDFELDTPLAQWRGRPRHWVAGAAARGTEGEAVSFRDGAATSEGPQGSRRNSGCYSKRNKKMVTQTHSGLNRCRISVTHQLMKLYTLISAASI